MKDVSYIGFKQKLLYYIKLEKEIEDIRDRYMKEIKKNIEPLNVYKWLEKNGYIIDPSLKELAVTINNRLLDIKKTLKDKEQEYRKLTDESIPIKNLRDVVFCLCKEENISLEQLAQILNSEKDTFINLCENGKIDKKNYIKVCDYFGLDPDYPYFLFYCKELKLEKEKNIYP